MKKLPSMDEINGGQSGRAFGDSVFVAVFCLFPRVLFYF
jgi:hypothetical protein